MRSGQRPPGRYEYRHQKYHELLYLEFLAEEEAREMAQVDLMVAAFTRAIPGIDDKAASAAFSRAKMNWIASYPHISKGRTGHEMQLAERMASVKKYRAMFPDAGSPS